MFQLIAAIVAIFLLGLLAIAAIYYGGGAHSDAKIRADYAGNMNSGAQIEGALRLYFNDHAMYPPSDLENDALLEFLVKNNYLKEVPVGDWTVNPRNLSRPIKSQTIDECSAMNRVAGYDINAVDLVDEPYKGCPPCNGLEGTPENALATKYKDWPVCQMFE